MNHLTFSPIGEIRTSSVILLCVLLSGLALSLNLLIAGVAPGVFGVANDHPVLSLNKLMLASIPAVLGNTLGFYLSYRSPGPRALVKFLVPAALFFVLFMSAPTWLLFTGGTPAAFALTALLNAAPVILAVSIFLSLRPHYTQTHIDLQRVTADAG